MSKEDVDDLSSLMSHGFTFIDSLRIVADSRNVRIINNVLCRLRLGEDMIKVMKSVCPKEYRNDFFSFIEFLSFKDSLVLCSKIYNEEKKEKEVLKKSLIYPVFLFFITTIGLFIFIDVCLPILIRLIDDFKSDSTYLINFRIVSLLIIKMVMFLSVILIISLFFFTRQKYQVSFYKFVNRYLKIKLFKQWVSSNFARYFYHCSSIGCKTKETITILKKLSRKPLIIFLAEDIDENLLCGNSMEDAIKSIYLDYSLQRFMTIAIHSSSMEKTLDSYIKLSHEKIKKRIRVTTKLLQLFTYSVVGIILIFVYQILILPLSIMSQI